MQILKPLALNEIGGRGNNEDSIFPQKDNADVTNRFFLVCDGMGGHENGEVASSSVCDSFAAFLKNIPPDSFDETVFERALSFAYDELDEKDNGSESSRKPGTTLTFLFLNNQQAFMAHIGDSRIYHLRKNDDGDTEILYQSSDHSLVNELLKAEVITEEEAANHPKKNMITRAMQPHLERRCKADIHTTSDVQEDDRFFLCSDGVIESLSNRQLCNIFSENTDDEAVMKAIFDRCNNHSRDNFSARLVSISEGITQPVADKKITVIEEDEDTTFFNPQTVSSNKEPGKSETQSVTTAPPKDTTPTGVPTARPKKSSKNRYLILSALTFALLGFGAYYLYLNYYTKPPQPTVTPENTGNTQQGTPVKQQQGTPAGNRPPVTVATPDTPVAPSDTSRRQITPSSTSVTPPTQTTTTTPTTPSNPQESPTVQEPPANTTVTQESDPPKPSPPAESENLAPTTNP